MKPNRFKLAVLRLWWRCLPNALKPTFLQPWHTCPGDADVDYYWRWHYVKLGLGGWFYDQFSDSYGEAWYADYDYSKEATS